jgi:hypothetical protein
MKGFENRKKYEYLIDGGMFPFHPSGPASLSPQRGMRPMAGPEARGHSNQGQAPCRARSEHRTPEQGFFPHQSYLQRSWFEVGLKQIKIESSSSMSSEQAPYKTTPQWL